MLSGSTGTIIQADHFFIDLRFYWRSLNRKGALTPDAPLTRANITIKVVCTIMEHEERIIALETKMAYLEHYIQELNQVVLNQEKVIKKLLLETDALKKQIEEKKESIPLNEKPPHY